MKVKITEITDRLYEDVDSAIVDDFYKGIKTKVDSKGYIDLDDAETQLYIRDFIEKLKAKKDYQADKTTEILRDYYNTKYDVKEESKLQESDIEGYDLVIHTGLNDIKSEEVLKSVIGQMSDGIWEDSPTMAKYWEFADIRKDGSEICICINNHDYRSGYKGKSEADISKYFANKVKQIVKEEGLDWNRNNEDKSSFLDRGSNVTVKDAYRVYDKLLSRKDRIAVKEAKEPEEYKGMDSKFRKFCKTYELDSTDYDQILETLDILEGEFGDSDGSYQELREYIQNVLIDNGSEEVEDKDVEIKADYDTDLDINASGNIEVFQAKSGHENHGYRFDSYENNKNDINSSRYAKVAAYNKNIDNEDINTILEALFNLGNSGEFHKDFPNARSISVSDIIKVKDKYYYVDRIGFVDVTDKFTEKVTEAYGDKYDNEIAERIEELFSDYKNIARDTYELKWNSADVEEKHELAKKAISEFTTKHPEVKTYIEEFADKLEDENYHTDREEFLKIYKVEETKKLNEVAKVSITKVIDSKEEAEDYVNNTPQFQVGQEVILTDWNGRQYHVTKTKDTRKKTEAIEKDIIWSSEYEDDEEYTKSQYDEYVTEYEPEEPKSFEEWKKDYFADESNFDEELEVSEEDYTEEELKEMYNDYVENYKDPGPSEYEKWKEGFYKQDSEDQWDVKSEDFSNNIFPEIESQCNSNTLILEGTAGRWNGNFKGGKIINADEEEIRDLMSKYDNVRIYRANDGQINMDFIHHDGTDTMALFTLPSTDEDIIKLAKAMNYETVVKNEYDLNGTESEEEINKYILDEFYQDMMYDIIDLEELFKHSDLLVKIKDVTSSGSLTESKETDEIRDGMINQFIEKGISEKEANYIVDTVIQLLSDALQGNRINESLDTFKDKLSIEMLGKVFDEMRNQGWKGTHEDIEEYFNKAISKINIKESKEPLVEEDNEELEVEDVEEVEFPLTDRDVEIFNALKNQEEQKTSYDYIQDRIGQQITVGEFNSLLQNLFNKYNQVFLLVNELYNVEDIDAPQDIIVFDDDDMYTITYNIVDLDQGVIEITDVNVE